MKWLFVVVLCVAAASAHHGAEGEMHDEEHVIREIEKDVKANMNEYFDNLLAQMRIYMQENGLVPMSLPESKHGFSVRVLFITWHGELELTKGTLSDISSVSREGDADLSYEGGKMIVKAVIGFSKLDLKYNYLAHIMNIGPDGGINGEVRGLKLNMAIEVDLLGGTQELKDLEVLKVGDLDIWLTGTIIIDQIANGIIGVVAWLFEDTIVDLVVAAVKDAVNSALASTPPPTSPAPIFAEQSGNLLMNLAHKMRA